MRGRTKQLGSAQNAYYSGTGIEIAHNFPSRCGASQEQMMKNSTGSFGRGAIAFRWFSLV